MKLLEHNLKALKTIVLILVSAFGFAQEGSVTIVQDPEIEKLLELKKEMSTNEDSNNRYKIQIFSGRRADAESNLASFKSNFAQWSSRLEYETPNYKVWVGNFRSHLEADRALFKIKQKFPNAFRFKPKEKD